MPRPTIKRRLKKIVKSPKLLLLTAILVVLSTTLLFANKGLWRHITLRHEISTRQDNLEKLQTEEKNLTARVNLLRSEDPNTIERIARERYSMKKPGEIIYREEKD